MKRLKVAIVLMIFIPALIFTCHFYLKHTTGEMSEELVHTQSLLQNGKKEEAAKQLAAFHNQWEKNKSIMSMFIRHSELDTVNLSAAKLKPYLEEDETGDFLAESNSLIYQLHHLWETEKFSLDNVL